MALEPPAAKLRPRGRSPAGTGPLKRARSAKRPGDRGRGLRGKGGARTGRRGEPLSQSNPAAVGAVGRWSPLPEACWTRCRLRAAPRVWRVRARRGGCGVLPLPGRPAGAASFRPAAFLRSTVRWKEQPLPAPAGPPGALGRLRRGHAGTPAALIPRAEEDEEEKTSSRGRFLRLRRPPGRDRRRMLSQRARGA